MSRFGGGEEFVKWIRGRRLSDYVVVSRKISGRCTNSLKCKKFVFLVSLCDKTEVK